MYTLFKYNKRSLSKKDYLHLVENDHQTDKMKFNHHTSKNLYVVCGDSKGSPLAGGEEIVSTHSKERLMVEVIKQIKNDGADYITTARNLFTCIYNNKGR